MSAGDVGWGGRSLFESCAGNELYAPVLSSVSTRETSCLALYSFGQQSAHSTCECILTKSPILLRPDFHEDDLGRDSARPLAESAGTGKNDRHRRRKILWFFSKPFFDLIEHEPAAVVDFDRVKSERSVMVRTIDPDEFVIGFGVGLDLEPSDQV